MPTFQGLVTEEGVVQLIEYVKSLGAGQATGTGNASGSHGVHPAESLDI